MPLILDGSPRRSPRRWRRYTEERELARGGYGVVYLARDPELDRHVAIKVLPPQRGRSAQARERLRAEARTISALDHPHIATIYEIDRTALGELFVVMGYYAGDTLRTHLAAGALPVEEAVRVAGRRHLGVRGDALRDVDGTAPLRWRAHGGAAPRHTLRRARADSQPAAWATG